VTIGKFKFSLASAVTSLALSACSPHFGLDSAGLSAAPTHDILTPVPVATSERFTTLAVGLWHACGLTSAGAVYCWGDNTYQQLGTLSILPTCQALDSPCSSSPLPVTGNGNFTRISASLSETCALTASGAAWCWGGGTPGQQAGSQSIPTPISAPVAFGAIALGGSGLIDCALGPAGAAYCWGPDGHGGLGNGTTAGSDLPVPVSDGLDFVSITVGDDHACGVTTEGQGFCWGDNTYGDLGTGVPGIATTPVPIAGGLTFKTLSAGLDHSCGLTADGSAFCWGFPAAVGSPLSGTEFADSPLPVAGGQHFTSITAGENFTCALDASGAAWCWGQNLGGELGNGTSTDSATPVAVQTSVKFVALWAGGSVCGLDAAGQAYCWGPNTAGQVGQPP
jgi:alpha-tubulin suppressor-like RCC1 family protein